MTKMTNDDARKKNAVERTRKQDTTPTMRTNNKRPTTMLRLVPITFLSYQFYRLLFVACFTVVFAVDNDFQKRKLSGTGRTADFSQNGQGVQLRTCATL